MIYVADTLITGLTDIKNGMSCTINGVAGSTYMAVIFYSKSSSETFFYCEGVYLPESNTLTNIENASGAYTCSGTMTFYPGQYNGQIVGIDRKTSGEIVRIFNNKAFGG